ncbi:nitrilase-related carbon-nitrogen hydrolase [Acidithiobacillus sp. IBUN Pt1247-S3]|uniref:nitrilase-related carbon-nitrogen hydrolase n=1 Tax=Acidithiobacillus sp. IBUN Pt1247-S3 TaxID=3166642 RepID=UPI0034E4E8B0
MSSAGTPSLATGQEGKPRGRICHDVEFPEVARTLAFSGAELMLVPTANMRSFESVADHLIPARAQENGMFVVYANYFGEETPMNDYLKDYREGMAHIRMLEA